jgi:hypothetical protein
VYESAEAMCTFPAFYRKQEFQKGVSQTYFSTDVNYSYKDEKKEGKRRTGEATLLIFVSLQIDGSVANEAAHRQRHEHATLLPYYTGPTSSSPHPHPHPQAPARQAL